MKNLDIEAYKKAQTAAELDLASQQILNAHFKQQQKRKWADQLEEKYGVKKPPQDDVKKNKLKTIIYWSAIAVAACLCLLLLIPKLVKESVKADQIVSSELSAPEPYFGIRKGVNQEIILRQNAYQNYQSKNYAQAINYFEQLSAENKMSNEDSLFLGLSFLYHSEYNKAIHYFEQSNLKTSYPERSNWFLSLAYYQSGQKEKSRVVLEKMKKNGEQSFKSQQIKALLKSDWK